MAVLKCKMCGGTLEIQEGMTVCECEYCGSVQTVPQLDDEVETLVAVELLEAPVMRPNGRLLRSPEYNVLLGVKALHTLFA